MVVDRASTPTPHTYQVCPDPDRARPFPRRLPPRHASPRLVARVRHPCRRQLQIRDDFHHTRAQREGAPDRTLGSCGGSRASAGPAVWVTPSAAGLQRSERPDTMRFQPGRSEPPGVVHPNPRKRARLVRAFTPPVKRFPPAVSLIIFSDLRKDHLRASPV